MDENMNQSTNTMQEEPVVDANAATPENAVGNAPVESAPQSPMDSSVASTPVYASFLSRLLALIIDSVILGIVAMVILLPIVAAIGDSASYMSNLFGLALWGGYTLFMLTKYGATLGKMVLGIKVVKQDTGEYLSPVDVFLREIVGRFVSQIVIFLGYFWMLWDPNKQTWHDKIAHTIVVRK